MIEMFTEFANSLIPDDFRRRMLVFVVGMVVIGFLVNLFLRKALDVQKRGLFKGSWVNARHKKVETGLNITGAIAAAVIAAYNIEEGLLYSITTLLVFGIIVTLYRGYMEKKYAENPRDYLFTLFEFPVIILFMLSFGGFLFPEISLF